MNIWQKICSLNEMQKRKSSIYFWPWDFHLALRLIWFQKQFFAPPNHQSKANKIEGNAYTQALDDNSENSVDKTILSIKCIFVVGINSILCHCWHLLEIIELKFIWFYLFKNSFLFKDIWSLNQAKFHIIQYANINFTIGLKLTIERDSY